MADLVDIIHLGQALGQTADQTLINRRPHCTIIRQPPWAGVVFHVYIDLGKAETSIPTPIVADVWPVWMLGDTESGILRATQATWGHDL